MDVIFVGGFFKGKTPEIIHPLPIMGKNLLILSNKAKVTEIPLGGHCKNANVTP